MTATNMCSNFGGFRSSPPFSAAKPSRVNYTLLEGLVLLAQENTTIQTVDIFVADPPWPPLGLVMFAQEQELHKPNLTVSVGH